MKLPQTGSYPLGIRVKPCRGQKWIALLHERGVGILWRSLEYIRIGALYDGKYDGIPNF
jgi:hypothetical protein